MSTPTDLLAAHGDALFTAVLKRTPQDFQVDEQLELEFSHAGEHLYVHLEKCSINTDEVLMLLAKVFDCQSADIGVAGLKDRHAQTRQWFSVRTEHSVSKLEQAIDDYNKQEQGTAEQLRALQQSGQADNNIFVKRLRVLSSCRHYRKLRRGAHLANRFVVTLRDVSWCNPGVADEEASAVAGAAEKSTAHLPDHMNNLERRVAQIRHSGFPNYLGPQRFGAGARNLVRARQWFKNPRKRVSRQQRGLWLSVARSALFNAVCRARVADESWQQLLVGEPAMLNGTHSFFMPDERQCEREGETVDQPMDAGESGADLTARLSRMDIHPTGPWCGAGSQVAQSSCADYEQSVLIQHDDLLKGLQRSRLPQERRALRACALDLDYSWLEDGALQLRFSLLPGVFATTLLNEIGHCAEVD